MTAVIDTGVLYALVDAADEAHARCVAAIEVETRAIILPMPVVGEVCALIGSRLGGASQAAFLRHLVDSDWRAEPLTEADLPRIAELLAEHAGSRGLSFADASVVAVAERMGSLRIYTLDKATFEGVRPAHVDRFELLPD